MANRPASPLALEAAPAPRAPALSRVITAASLIGAPSLIFAAVLGGAAAVGFGVPDTLRRLALALIFFGFVAGAVRAASVTQRRGFRFGGLVLTAFGALTFVVVVRDLATATAGVAAAASLGGTVLLVLGRQR